MLLGLICAVTLVQDRQPAFLDSRDTITVWTSKAVSANEPLPAVAVSLNGTGLEVASIERAGLIAAPSKPRPNIVVLAGSFQHILGGNDWMPGDEAWEMKKVRADQFEYVVRLPKGHFEYKVAVGGSWDKNYGANLKPGGANVGIDVPQDQMAVRFLVDFAGGRLSDSINDPAHVKPPAASLSAAPAPKIGVANVFRVHLREQLPLAKIPSDIRISLSGGSWRPVYFRDVLNDPLLYPGTESLGSRFTPSQTLFKVWSPVSNSVDLELGSRTLPMQRSNRGLWMASIKGNLNGHRYRYRFHSYGEERIAPDVNCVAATRDGKWSVVTDLAQTNPHSRLSARPPIIPPTKLSIYELHVRDFTIDRSSGVPAALRGKYLGMVHVGAQNTGLNYLKWLGINAVQIMPIQMFNPDHPDSYDWGYDTNLFNVPESRYSTRPDDPVTTIRETKSMIEGLHQAGIRVIMDVVYNHSVPSEVSLSAFWQTVPYYYFRTDAKGQVQNESGVGNALDDDHPIVRKYIRDSLCFWAKEYGVDGFRFDLLGMFRKDSVLDWKKALGAVSPGIFMYGEPWTGGGPLRFGKGDQRGTGVGVFNDNFRNAIRGELDGAAPGFAMGKSGSEAAVAKGLAGSLDDFASSPEETINYVSAHDNMTLWDKICLSMPNRSESERKQSLRLCGALVLAAQGVSFLEGGAELGRTKLGNNNSYNAGDRINAFDWDRAKSFMDVAESYRVMLRTRRDSKDLGLGTAADIRQKLRVQSAPGVLSLTAPQFEGAFNGTFESQIAPGILPVRQLRPLGFYLQRK